jgi:hypothetical protein
MVRAVAKRWVETQRRRVRRLVRMGRLSVRAGRARLHRLGVAL